MINVNRKVKIKKEPTNGAVTRIRNWAIACTQFFCQDMPRCSRNELAIPDLLVCLFILKGSDGGSYTESCSQHGCYVT